MAKKGINRIKVILAEQDKTNLWLAKKIGVTPNTVSRWYTNEMQPSLETLVEIAAALKVNVQTLLVPTNV